jgi:putative transposase
MTHRTWGRKRDLPAKQLDRRGPAEFPNPTRNFLRQHAASTLVCDFFTVETAWLKRLYVLFFLSLDRRRVEFVACTPNPTGAWSPSSRATC